MGPTAGYAADDVASAVVLEAIDEVTGASNRKWAVMLMAFVLGAVVALVAVRRRAEQRFSSPRRTGVVSTIIHPGWTDPATAGRGATMYVAGTAT